MTDRLQSSPVLSELDQQVSQLDQQGGEAPGGLWIGKELELARVGGSAQIEGQRATAATAGGDANGVELHRKELLFRRGHWWVDCSCGWLSPGFVREDVARTVECNVEWLLGVSAERRRRLIEEG